MYIPVCIYIYIFTYTYICILYILAIYILILKIPRMQVNLLRFVCYYVSFQATSGCESFPVVSRYCVVLAEISVSWSKVGLNGGVKCWVLTICMYITLYNYIIYICLHRGCDYDNATYFFLAIVFLRISDTSVGSVKIWSPSLAGFDPHQWVSTGTWLKSYDS